MVSAKSCSAFRFGLNPGLKGKPTVLRHVRPATALIDYHSAAEQQEKLVRQNLDHKKDLSSSKNNAPLPTLLSYEMTPVYACGRRERGKLSDQLIQHFKADGKAQFVETGRGGQTTFHGPGQLVVYPIIDLRQFGITPKCYVSLLEQSIIDTLDKYGIDARTTENTGVWVSDQHKIAAIGVHVRRNVTSHGIALNVNTDLSWFDRIVACGLPDKSTTSIAAQLPGRDNLSVADVADTFAACMAANLHCNLE